MGEGGGWARYHLSRRDFLRYSLATGAVVWAGSQVPRGSIGAAEAEELFGAADFDPPNLKFFPQSVASGDPAPGGIVLWRGRCRPRRTAMGPSGSGTASPSTTSGPTRTLS